MSDGDAAAERPALVLLHAFGASGRSFAPLVEQLPGVEVYAPDLPGFASLPALARPSVSAYADWVADFVAREGLGRAALGGWSMGGKIALALARRRPPWLERLLLIAPSPPGPEPMDEADRRVQLDGFGDRALARRAVTSLIATSPAAALLDAAVDNRLAVLEAAWRWWLEAGSREDLSQAPPAPTPALLLVGADDPNLGEAVQRRMTLPALANGSLETIAACGHFAPIERPEALARRVSAWIAEG